MLIVYPTPKNLQVVSFLQMATIIYLLVVGRVFLVASATVTMGTRSLPLSTSKKNARFRERKRFSNNFFHSAEVILDVKTKNSNGIVLIFIFKMLFFPGCNLEFSSMAELDLHTLSPCFPSPTLLDSIYARAEAQTPFPFWNQQNPDILFSTGNVQIVRNCDSSPSLPRVSDYDWSASSLLHEHDARVETSAMIGCPEEKLQQGRQQKPMAQFGLDPALIRCQAQRNDDLWAKTENREVTRNRIRNVLEKVGLADGSDADWPFPDSPRFSCYEEATGSSNIMSEKTDFPKPFSSPSNSADNRLQDLAQEKDSTNRTNQSAYLVLKPISSLTNQPETFLPTSPTVSDSVHLRTNVDVASEEVFLNCLDIATEPTLLSLSLPQYEENWIISSPSFERPQHSLSPNNLPSSSSQFEEREAAPHCASSQQQPNNHPSQNIQTTSPPSSSSQPGECKLTILSQVRTCPLLYQFLLKKSNLTMDCLTGDYIYIIRVEH